MSMFAGLRAFVLVWCGQIVSLLATDMSRFALGVWAFEKTGSATAIGLVFTFYVAPLLVISPFAGALVDRGNRKLMMALSDLGAGLATVLIFSMQLAGALEVWHLYAASFITGIFGAFQWPAYSASISLMVPKDQLGRVNGMMSLQESVPHVVSPLLAGALLPVIGLTGLLIFDIVTFVLAIAALALAVVPQPPPPPQPHTRRPSLLAESADGFRYILARPSLLGLQLVFFCGNLLSGLCFTMITPLILSRTGGDAWVLGGVNSAGAIGSVLGGVIMSAWGGFKRRAIGVLAGHTLMGLGWALLFGLAQSWPLWMLASLLGGLFVPLMNGSNQAIWQSKVDPGIQGRVFAARRLIAWVPQPLMPILAGQLADRWLEPAMRAPNAASVLVGSGPGAGIALLFVCSGVLTIAMGLIASTVRVVREADRLLPDHAATPDRAH